MAWIEKRQGKRGPRWHVRWRAEHGRVAYRIFTSQRDAERFYHAVELGIEPSRGESEGLVETAERPTLRSVISAYVAECAVLQAPATSRQKAITLELFLRYVEGRHGPDVEPRRLTKALLIDWYVELGRPETPGAASRTLSTRAKMLQRVESAWKWAANGETFDGHIPTPRHLPVPHEPRSPTVAPTWAEMDACIRATLAAWGGQGAGRRAPNVPLYRLAVVLRCTGLRVQQAMQLRWTDFDLARATLLVRGELGKSRQERSGRFVPVSPYLVSEIQTWAEPADRTGWLLPSERTGEFERVARQREMVTAWGLAGVREAAWRGRSHHAFRKGFVSELRRAGADPDAVEYLVGHSLQLRGVYTDPDALPLRAAVALIPSLSRGDG